MNMKKAILAAVLVGLLVTSCNLFGDKKDENIENPETPTVVEDTTAQVTDTTAQTGTADSATVAK